MKILLFVVASITVLLAGLAWLSAMPAGHADNGVFADFSSPVGALASYIAAVYAVDEKMENMTADRPLRYRSNRYRGFDVIDRTASLADKMRCYSQTVFKVRTVKIWADTAVVTVDQVSSAGNPVPYVFSFRREAGEWKISGMSTGDPAKY